MPFPARLFRTGELVIELPHLPGELVRELSRSPGLRKSIQEEFAKRGGFALRAQRMFLHVPEVEGTPSLKAGEATYNAMDSFSNYPDEYVAWVL
jgi:hypothetical protein